MKRNTYSSNILRHWPIEAQRAELAKIPKPVEAYEDILNARQLKAHSTADLKDRAELLRKTGRKGGEETIYTVSLGVIGGWTAEHFMDCMGAAAARNATVTALDTGSSIAPTASAGQLAAALSEFLTARRRHQTSGGRLAGVEASKAVRMADRAARMALIEADWHGVDVPTDELLVRAGKERRGRIVPMAWSTAVKYLGRRPTPAKMRAAKMEKQNAG